MDTQTQLANSKEHIRMLTETVTRMKDIAEHMVIRSTGFATDMLQFGRQLRYIKLNDCVSVDMTCGNGYVHI